MLCRFCLRAGRQRVKEKITTPFAKTGLSAILFWKRAQQYFAGGIFTHMQVGCGKEIFYGQKKCLEGIYTGTVKGA